MGPVGRAGSSEGRSEGGWGSWAGQGTPSAAEREGAEPQTQVRVGSLGARTQKGPRRAGRAPVAARGAFGNAFVHVCGHACIGFPFSRKFAAVGDGTLGVYGVGFSNNGEMIKNMNFRS